MSSSPPPNGARLRRLAGAVFAAATLIFLAMFVAGNVGELRNHEWSVRPGLLVLSVVLNILVLLGGVGIWQVLLYRAGIPIGLMPLARVWFLSSLGRYIPGKIWQFIGAAHIGARVSLPAPVTVVTLAAHSGYFFLGAILAAAYFLPRELIERSGVPPVAVWALAPLVLLLAHPAVIRSALALLRRAASTWTTHWSPRWTDGLLLVGLSAVSWAFSGLALYLFVLSITPDPEVPLSALIGFNALTFIVGNAVFIAPAGLGAKEGALTVLLSIYLPAPVAALIAVATRLWMVGAEVIPALLLLREPRPSIPPPEGAADSVTPP